MSVLHMMIDKDLWVEALATHSQWSPDELAAGFARDDLSPLRKEQGLLALQGNAVYPLLLLEAPELIATLIERHLIQPKHAKLLQVAVGQAMDNAAEQRHEDGWEDPLYGCLLAIEQFRERYPDEAAEA